MITYLSTMLPTLGALGAVLALVLLSGHLAKLAGISRRVLSHPKRNARLLIQDTLALDRSRSLHIISCDGRDLLILTGGSRDLIVSWLTDDGHTP